MPLSLHPPSSSSRSRSPHLPSRPRQTLRPIRRQLDPHLLPIQVGHPHPHSIPHGHVIAGRSPGHPPELRVVHKVQESVHLGPQLDVSAVRRHSADLPPQFVVDGQFVQQDGILLGFVVRIRLLLRREHRQLHLLQFGGRTYHPYLHLVPGPEDLAGVLNEHLAGDLGDVKEAVALGPDVDVGAEIGEGDDGAREGGADLYVREGDAVRRADGGGTDGAGIALLLPRYLLVEHHHPWGGWLVERGEERRGIIARRKRRGKVAREGWH
mmetsp:Transcript_33750/g.100690  ORF Transcript_33750/g.100690 Transcript_33750/m.100690 type:complete len:267 (-) Transcript_33750:214-1014(-)